MDEDSVRSSVRKFVVQVTFPPTEWFGPLFGHYAAGQGLGKGRKAQLGSGGGVRHLTNCLASKTNSFTQKYP